MLEKDELRKAIDDYVENYSIEANFSPRTIQNKRGCYTRFLKWIGDKQYTLQTIREYFLYLSQKGLQANSLLDETRMFRALTNFLFKRGYIKESFAKDITKPKITQKPFTYVAPEKVEEIIKAGTIIGKGDRQRSKFYKNEARLALQLILRTGLRINEIVTLKGSYLNLDDEPPTFYVHSKGGDIDLLPFPRDMIDILRERSTNKKVFAVSEKLCNEVLKRGAERLGIRAKLTCHSLRHIFASNLVKNKVPIQFVSRLMRHSSVEITDKTYTHLDITDLALVMNGTQTIVREGLKENEIFDMVMAAIKNTGVNKDGRYVLKHKLGKGSLQINLCIKSIGNKINLEDLFPNR